MKDINIINVNTTNKRLLNSLEDLENLFDEMLKVQALESGHQMFENIGYYIDSSSWHSSASSKDMYFVLKFGNEEVTHNSSREVTAHTEKNNISLESFIRKVREAFSLIEVPSYRSIRFMGKRYKLVEIENN
jgi:hypothetical protein